MKKILFHIGLAFGKLIVRYRAWRVAQRMKRIEADCRWIERYARNAGIARPERKKLFRRMGKLVFGLSVARGIGQPQAQEKKPGNMAPDDPRLKSSFIISPTEIETS